MSARWWSIKAASFLCGADASRYFYWRQLRDMKGSALVDEMSAAALEFYTGAAYAFDAFTNGG